jgi:hypothetical protein
MTTYDFIVSEQRKQKARQIEMRQQQQQRESANPTAGAVKTTSSRSTSVSGVRTSYMHKYVEFLGTTILL